MVGDSEAELWTETASSTSSSAIVASVATGEDSGCPSCTSCSSFSVSRSETERTSGVALAEASNSLALIGLVAVAGPVQIRGHRGLAALSMRHKSTLGAMLRRCNLVHCVGPPCLALVGSAGSFLRCTFFLGQSCCGEAANVLAAARLL